MDENNAFFCNISAFDTTSFESSIRVKPIRLVFNSMDESVRDITAHSGLQMRQNFDACRKIAR